VTKVNLSDEEFVELILSFTTNPDTAIVVKEHTPKDHYHCYVEDCFTPPTIRDRLGKVCPTKNNDSYSVSDKHHDWLGYKGYLVKYEDTTILHCNYDVEELKSYYESQAVKSEKFKRRTEYTKIYNYVMANIPDGPPDLRTIAKMICEFYIEEQKIFNKYNMAQILNTIWYQINDSKDESFLDSMLEEANIRTQYGKRVVTKSTSYFQTDPE
jgi:hypothetical protein